MSNTKRTTVTHGKKEVKQCNSCGRTLSIAHNFYKLSSENLNFPDGRVNVCIKCYNELWNHPTHGFSHFMEFLRVADLPYLEEVYARLDKKSEYLATVRAGSRSKLRFQDSTGFKERKMGQANEDKLKTLTKEQLKECQEFWGEDFTEEEYIFLTNEYNDYNTQYDITGKTMQVLVRGICVVTLKIRDAQNKGHSTKELNRELRDLMDSANIKPSQERAALENEKNNFGNFIKMVENTQPIPEAEGVFADPDKVEEYLNTFFINPTAESLGLPMPYPELHEKMMEELDLHNIHEEVSMNNDNED